MLYPRRPDGWPLGEPSDQLIEEFLCTDLEMEGVSAVFHTYIEELCTLDTNSAVHSLKPRAGRRAKYAPPKPGERHSDFGN